MDLVGPQRAGGSRCPAGSAALPPTPTLPLRMDGSGQRSPLLGTHLFLLVGDVADTHEACDWGTGYSNF